MTVIPQRLHRFLALCWLMLVLTALAYLGWRASEGLYFRADLMALVPSEQSDPQASQAARKAIDILSRRVVFLVGAPDRATARRAAAELTTELEKSGQFHTTTGGMDSAKIRAIGAAYYPHRSGLLSKGDRALLQAGRGLELVQQSLAQVYGVGGMTSATLLRNDPFLLLPRFLAHLPVPASSLTADDGMLSLSEGGTYRVLVSGVMHGEPYAIDAQKHFITAVDQIIAKQTQRAPGVNVLRAGAVFYAGAGAQSAMDESATIGFLSVALTVLLLLAAFRSATPLLLSLAVIAVGLLTAFAFSLWLWGQMHVLALLFGVSLIGVTVDYSLQYFCEIYAPDSTSPAERMKHVLPGITLGALATLGGYLLLLLAPFPGLRQIAAFSGVGLTAAWLTVALWLPCLDRTITAPRTMPLARPLSALRNFWHQPSRRPYRVATIVFLLLLCLFGGGRIHTDDDVHNMQRLSPSLVAEQNAIQHAIGVSEESRFFVVYAGREEEALQQEEVLGRRLDRLVAAGHLGGYQSVAGFVPSLKTQRENRRLIQDRLYTPYLAEHLATLGMNAPQPQPQDATGLTADGLSKDLDFLALLRPQIQKNGVVHIVTLQTVKNPAALREATKGLTGVRLITPGEDFSALFAKYRQRALGLLALSVLAMLTVILLPRYGLRRALTVIRAPLAAVAATPFLCALTGAGFTFFDVIALVLVLSMAMDYAVFFAESNVRRLAATHLAVTLSACTTIISFGFLTFSSVQAVHNFGLTMLIGVTLALLLTPIWQGHKA